jgi:hypothetical protein
MDRLEVLADGRLLYRFKRAWRDGRTHVILTPLETLEKISALIPAPRAHLIRYAGILAPAAKWRALIVPATTASTAAECSSGSPTTPCSLQSPDTAAQAGPPSSEGSTAPHRRNYAWAELMKRVWELDVLECPRCQARMRILAAIHSPEAIGKILDCLSLPSRAPPVAPARREFPPSVQPF